MNILTYFGHPSQYFFLKKTFEVLKSKGHNIDILIKSKDVLEDLLISNNEVFINILPEGRVSSKIGIIVGLIKRDRRLFQFTRKRNYDLFIGTDPSLAHIGWIKRIPVITVLEDDIKIIQKLAKLTFPFTSIILTPNECSTGKYEKKTIHYDGYMKLAYLHPNYFNKKVKKNNPPYFIIRKSNLDAHHDGNVGGLSKPVLDKVIQILTPLGQVYISYEGKLPYDFEQYKLTIKATEMHAYLANATILISDSQSMSMEAAMLGVPSIRFSDFAGRISVLEELERKYGLTFGIKTTAPEELISKMNELLSIPNLCQEFQNRRQKMLADKINVTAFMVWFIENFPKSAKIMKENPDFQYAFK